MWPLAPSTTQPLYGTPRLGGNIGLLYSLPTPLRERVALITEGEREFGLVMVESGGSTNSQRREREFGLAMVESGSSTNSQRREREFGLAMVESGSSTNSQRRERVWSCNGGSSTIN